MFGFGPHRGEIGAVRPRRQRHRQRARGADGGRAAHGERADRRDDLLDGAQPRDPVLARQRPLVDDVHLAVDPVH
ncbi:Uncharacterised protein [Mycobacteroides abscessus subsp. abscessus]|nr:Uncharacterised protein [Mycobacteroides abscessus subsp. abscessus]